jgi:RNA polymerase sigma-70 factor, ECF subfamily
LATEKDKGASDEDLMQAVARGDLDAFGEIVLRYQELAWRSAFRLLGSSMEAEDAAQETFLKIMEAAPRYRPTAAFRTYFYRVLTHLCIDRTRKKRPSNIEDIPDMPDPSASPAENLIEQERKAQVRSALDTLPVNQKAAMILRHYEGLSYAEIAQVMEVTPKAVERLIARAAASLQARLAPL